MAKGTAFVPGDVSDDATLDEFADAGTEDSPETDSGDDERPDRTDPERRAAGIRSTFAWSPSGAVCARCEATVENRWRDEERMVCPECVEW